jgi:hypothetical protein
MALDREQESIEVACCALNAVQDRHKTPQRWKTHKTHTITAGLYFTCRAVWLELTSCYIVYEFANVRGVQCL